MTLLQLTCIIAAPIVIALLLKEYREYRRDKQYQKHLNQHIREILNRNGSKQWEITRRR